MNLFHCAMTSFFILAGSVMPARYAQADDSPEVKIAVRTKRTDDKVSDESEAGKAVFLIRSPYGISQAVIERMGEQWPTLIVLKLQLNAIEHLRLTNGKTTLEAAVSVHDDKLAVRLWKDKAEDVPLDPTSPYWMKVRLLGSDGKPAGSIPLRDRVFELNLPKALLENNPKSITVDWIDFYRG